MIRPTTTVLALGVLSLAIGCKRAPTPAPSPHAATPSVPASVEVRAGRVRIGSLPGTPGRSSASEADLAPVALGSFAIDRRPFASGASPRTAATRDEARALCARDGKRLCSELEWERACLGDGAGPYPTGTSIDLDRCANEPCASPLGVESLGTRMAEWTASDAHARGADGQPLAVIRGSAGRAPDEHRCAARRFVAPSTVDPGIGFRCCTGEAPTATYPVEPAAPVYESIDLDAEHLRAALAAVPELARYAADFRLFRDSERDEVVRRAAGGNPPIVLAPARIVRSVLKWTPVQGDTVWVLVGKSGDTSLVAVLYPLADGGFAHAASLVMPHDPSTIVLMMRDPENHELGFSTCFGCGGEDGEIKLRDDGRFVVVTR